MNKTIAVIRGDGIGPEVIGQAMRVLEKIAARFSTSFEPWEGTATELCSLLQVDVKPNMLTMKLNINADRLFKEHSIRYTNRRTHDGRKVHLWREA